MTPVSTTTNKPGKAIEVGTYPIIAIAITPFQPTRGRGCATRWPVPASGPGRPVSTG